MGVKGRGTETEVWIIAAQWRLCLMFEVSRPIKGGMCPAEECCSTERLSLSGVQQVRTTERRRRASSLREIEIEERKGGLRLSQAIISL